MKFYVASSLDNATTVRWLARELVGRGWAWTYDWPNKPDLRTGDRGYTDTELWKRALDERHGVAEADVVIAILPGGRGTYIEFGMALALQKYVIVLAKTEEDLNAGYKYPCAFLPLANKIMVHRLMHNAAIEIQELARQKWPALHRQQELHEETARKRVPR